MRKTHKIPKKKPFHKVSKGKKAFVRYRIILLPLACFAFGIFAGLLDLTLSPKRQCAEACLTDSQLSGQYQKEGSVATFMGNHVVVPPFIAEAINPQKEVLGASIGPKHIYIDLTNQRLLAFEGNTLVYNFTVATGWWNKTPTGDFSVWIKLRYGRMTGGSGADYYDLPNIPFIMYLYNSDHPKYEGYGIHDAYWLTDADFGHPRSHGCINLKYADSQNLYNWATPMTTGYTTYATDANSGTPVSIYGTTPNHYW